MGENKKPPKRFSPLIHLVFKMGVSQIREYVSHGSVFLVILEKMFSCTAFDHKIVMAWGVLYQLMFPFFYQEVSL